MARVFFPGPQRVLSYWLMAATTVVLFSGVLHSSPANAVPITYTYDGVGSGTIGTSTFSGAAFSIVASADTDNIQPWSNADLQNTHLSTSIHISGVGTFDILTASHTWIAQNCCAGIGEDLSSNWITMNSTQLIDVGYGLDTNIGPIIDNSPSNINQFTGVSTSGGTMAFSSVSTVSFTATVVPEPSTAILLTIGLVGLGYSKKR